MTKDARGDLLRVYQAAIARVSGAEAVKGHLESKPLPQGAHRLIAIGKAAAAMTLGAVAAMGASIEAGLVITKRGHLDEALSEHPHLRCLESDHPVPGEASLAAGRALLEFIEDSPQDARFLVLISGGASSLAEVLADGMDLEGLSQLTDALLAGGLDIARMNQVRRAISCIKGGRLAAYFKARAVTCLLISDVPGDDPAVIGSGPLVRSAEAGLPALPARVSALLEGVELPSAPPPEAFERVSIHVIATLEDAKTAAAEEARRLGYSVSVYPEFVEGEAVEAARRICGELAAAPAGMHVWGGESAVNLPETPGRGGRNQHLALAAALELREQPGLYLLSAGTDGTDGPTDDAGALVDGQTLARGEQAGIDARACLHAADGGRFLEASGDLIRTGPTGTNVMDLIVGLRT